MSVGETNHTARYREIASVLGRHSLGFLAALLGIGGLGARRPTAGASADGASDAAVHLRLALEELGPTFVKLGQVLSTRPDLLPPDFVTELSRLQDDAPPVPVALVRDVIRRELGGTPEELFAWFDDEPLASASIGQAHAATLEDGTPVVVKVRRPGAVAQVQEDIEILQNLAERAARTWDIAKDYDAVGLADEFAATIRAELDYLREARNAERFAEDFAAAPDVVIPRVFWERTTSRVLTLERMYGTKVSDADELDTLGVDRPRLARRGADAVLKMVFEDRFFHADLHPGNVFIHDDGSIVLIDFGMVGVVEERLRRYLGDLFIALVRGDADAMTTALIAASTRASSVDRAMLHDDLRGFLSRYRLRSLRETPFAHMMADLFTILRTNRLRLPNQMALLFKVLLQIEGLALRLDPDFRLGDALAPYVGRLARERTNLPAFLRRAARATADMNELALDIPGVLRRVIDRIDTTGLEVHIRAADLEPMVGRIERVGNRLVAGMISAALITGIGGLVSNERKWRSWEGTLLGTGLGAIGALGGYLAWTARRQNRRGR